MRTWSRGFLLLSVFLAVSAEDNSLSETSVESIAGANADQVRPGQTPTPAPTGIASLLSALSPTPAPAPGATPKPLVTTDQVNSVAAMAGSLAGSFSQKGKSGAEETETMMNGLGNMLGNLAPQDAAAVQASNISTASNGITRGIIEGFFNGKIDEVELKCLEKNIGDISQDVFQSGEDIVRAIISLIPKVKAHVNIMTAVMGSDVLGRVSDAGAKIMDCVGRVTTVAKTCVKDDALVLLNKTAKHLENMTYLANRLVVNTVNITEFLADSIVQWDQKDYRTFGDDIGTTLRKILLSKGGDMKDQLPEGIPPPEILEEIMEGALMGYFVQGTTLDVKNKNTGQIDMTIDLKHCIADNHLFFRSAWKTAWFMIAKMQNTIKEKNKEKAFKAAGLEAPAEQPAGQPAFIGEGMMALAQIPSLLMTCNINSETKQAFSNGQQTMEDIALKMNFPDIPIDEGEVSLRVEQAAKFWEEHDFDKLGIVIGLLMRDLSILINGEKYEYSHGILRLKRVLMEENSLWHRVQHPTGILALDAGLGLLAVVAVASVAFRAVRVMRGDPSNTFLEVDEVAPLRSSTSHRSPPVASSSMLLEDVEVVEA